MIRTIGMLIVSALIGYNTMTIYVQALDRQMIVQQEMY